METKEQLQTAPEVPVIADAPEQDSTPTWKAPKKKRRWPKVVIAVLLVLAALFFFVIRPMLGAGKELLAGAYLTSTAQMQEMTVSVSSTGTIQPIDSYNVSGMVTGEVLEAPFEVGDPRWKRATSSTASIPAVPRPLCSRPSCRCSRPSSTTTPS